ncbi:tRNA (guanosine(18)-2'-O)-methyltransferase TrmH [Serratia symbiotica]|uniref:tRNA (guanosine(18)-2'-O)-methyltransferase TrmH n=1 Tax=Serratia symbiotica TaxID=138074 RepID=UPI0030D225B0|nr:tRNA (guanosine(18)-2'-O)-methyltransferase TrmH [Serratia symbiotica]
MSPERYARISEILATRQPHLTVYLEQVLKPHNISAIIRTADAIGIHQVHAVWPTTRIRTLVYSAAGSNIKTHHTISDAVNHLKTQGMQVLATHLSFRAVDFREVDYTRQTCVLLGQEKTGMTVEALALADKDIIIPMIGMVQSLNVSVASAFILYEAQRQRQIAGLYQRDRSMLDEEEQQRLLFEGGYPVLANVAKRKGLPRLHIDDRGQVVAETKWWAAMQATVRQ